MAIVNEHILEYTQIDIGTIVTNVIFQMLVSMLIAIAVSKKWGKYERKNRNANIFLCTDSSIAILKQNLENRNHWIPYNGKLNGDNIAYQISNCKDT